MTSLRLVQPKNMLSGILVMLSGRTTDVRLEHWEKADWPTLVTLPGMDTLVSCLQFEHADILMVVTLSGIMICFVPKPAHSSVVLSVLYSTTSIV